jgi:hypothetical protein
MVGVFVLRLYCFRRSLSSSFEVMDGDNQETELKRIAQY